MTALTWTFDGLLVLILLGLAWRTLVDPNLFKAIILFITFGLLMAVAWVRLRAPDVALAEAGVGAGLTGALLLAAWTRLAPNATREPESRASESHSSLRCRWLLPIIVGVTGLLGLATLSLPGRAPGLSLAVQTHLSASGVSNPVTAVLLNFRGYDTLLEMGVLLLALMGAWSVTSASAPVRKETGPILLFLVQFLTPLMIVIAGYLLWVGAHAPGGAFQAGAVLAAAGVSMILAGKRLPDRLAGWPLRAALVVGLGAFIAVAGGTTVIVGRLLEYPSTLAGGLILLIEAAATVAIGATLAALFQNERPEESD
jgi:multisubunit Na+/H+ antiporter MnhB subunit